MTGCIFCEEWNKYVQPLAENLKLKREELGDLVGESIVGDLVHHRALLSDESKLKLAMFCGPHGYALLKAYRAKRGMECHEEK